MHTHKDTIPMKKWNTPKRAKARKLASLEAELREAQSEMGALARAGWLPSYPPQEVLTRKVFRLKQEIKMETTKAPMSGGPLQGNLPKRTKHEGVGTQAHYNNFAIEPIDYVVKNKLGFLEGNVIKYVTRHKLKNGVEDLKKAQQYLTWLIEEYGTHSPLDDHMTKAVKAIERSNRQVFDELEANDV